ncbi:MAG TPA: heavy metal-associated domain-containing protein [Dehalococcoidia bacterium]|nr:heavy metal-associated domain-containing protein [Dehalococcoidia bacterium]
MRIIWRNLFASPVAKRAPAEGLDAGQTRFRISGMVCDVCARRVKQALSDLQGVDSVEVDLEQGAALINAHRTLSEEEVSYAVQRKVILPDARKWLTKVPLGRNQS